MILLACIAGDRHMRHRLAGHAIPAQMCVE
jgi:hypothetical protein